MVKGALDGVVIADIISSLQGVLGVSAEIASYSPAAIPLSALWAVHQTEEGKKFRNYMQEMENDIYDEYEE